MDWNALHIGWRASFGEAWDAYRRGASPIGATVVHNDRVISRGQNRTRDHAAPPGQIFANELAHAEINALLQLDNRQHPDRKSYALYTTLEPCALCIGAFYLSGLRTLKFAARETDGGSTNLIGATPYLSRKPILLEGPVAILEEVQIVIRADWALRCNIQSVIEKERALSPRAGELGEQWHRDGTTAALAARHSDFEPVYDAIVAGLHL